MSSQDIHSLFKKREEVKSLFKTNKNVEDEKLSLSERRIKEEEEKTKKHRSVISKNQREFIKRKLKDGKRSVTIYVDDNLMQRLDTEVGYETNRSNKMEEIIKFFFDYKDKV